MSKSITGRTQLNIGTINLNNIVADTIEANNSIKGDYLTASKGLATNADKKIVSTTATSAEIDFLTGATSNIQTQLNNKLLGDGIAPAFQYASDASAGLFNILTMNFQAPANDDNIHASSAKQIKDALDTKEPTISLTANRALISSGSGTLAVSDITNTELGYLDGASSNIQTQLTTNASAITTANSAIATNTTAIATNATAIAGKEPTVSLTANRALISSGSGTLAVSDITNTELGYLDGVSSNIQTQLNGKQPEIDSSNRLDVILCGIGNVDNESFVQLSGADLLSDTIKNILTTPSTKLIQAGSNLSYNTSTTPPTLNATDTDTNPWAINGNIISYTSGQVGIGDAGASDKALSVRRDGLTQTLQMWVSDLGTTGDRTLLLRTPDADSAGSPFEFQTGNALSFIIDSIEALCISDGGKVGIGTASPTQSLDVNGTALTAYVSISNHSTLGMIGSRNFNSYSSNTYALLLNGTTTYLNGYGTSGTPLRFRTNGSDRMYLSYDGKFGVGTSNPAELLHVNGVCRATSFTTTSDDRVKHFETPTTDCLTKIMSLKPTTYQKSNELYDISFVLADDKSNLKEGDELHLEVGFIAQELKASIYEEFSSSVKGGDFMGYPVVNEEPVDSSDNVVDSSDNVVVEEEPAEKVLIEQEYTLNYNNIFVVAVGAIQELKAEIETLKERIAILEE